MPDAQLSPHFKRSEFACKDACGFDDVDPILVLLLEDIREYFDAPVIVHSGCRCPRHNHAVGGAKHSQHLLGKAADITVQGHTPDEVADVIESRYPQSGGLGRYDSFTHVDVRKTLARWDNRST